MKKIWVIAIFLLIVIVGWMIGTGYTYETSAYISEYTVSEDGSEIRFTVDVGSSLGYVRGFKDEGGGIKPHYLKFYSAWGGLNSAIGAKSEFVMPLAPDDTEIYIYHGNQGYSLILQRNAETGQWFRVK